MAALPEIADAVAQVRAPQSRVSPGQVAEPYTELANTLNQVSGTLSQTVAEPLAREAGLQAVTRDADGNVQVQKAPIFGDAALEYGRAVKISALADGEGVARRDDIALRKQYRDDPEKYVEAADQYRKDKIAQYSKAAGTEVGIALGKAIDQQTTLTYKGLVNEKEGLDLTRATTSIQAELSQTENELFALANGGVTTGGEYDSRIQKIKTLRDTLVNNPRLAYPQAKADFDNEQMISTLRASAVSGNIERVYKSEGPEEAMKVADNILTDTSYHLTQQQREQLNARAVGAVQGMMRNQQLTDKTISSAVDDVNKIVTEGFKPTDDRLTRLKQVIAENKNPALDHYYRTSMENMETLQSWRQLSPGQLSTQLDRLERNMQGEGASDQGRSLLDSGRKLMETMSKELHDDPLGWANRVGTAAVSPIDFASKAAPLDMHGRIAVAEMVAQQYGIPPVYLRPEEKRALATSTAAGGMTLMTSAKNIADGFGDRSSKALAEVSKDAPTLAHLGGMLSGSLFGGGSVEFAGDVAQFVQLSRDPETAKTLPHWVTRPPDNKYNLEAAHRVDQYGDAFMAVPDVGRSAESAAKAAFATRAMRNGYTLDDLDRGGSPSSEAYNRALQQAAGATFDTKGTQYGGLTSFRAAGNYPWSWSNRQVLVPSTIRSDMFKDVIGKITDDDLSKMPISPMRPGGRADMSASTQNLRAADAEMKLTPQERSMYERHLTNLVGPGGVTNPDGSRSTLFQVSFESDGRTYNVPSVYGGKILPPREAIDRAMQEGINKFPSYGSQEEAESRYNRMHDFMEKDTQQFLQGSRSGVGAKPYTARDLQSAVPVAVPGGYQFAHGDPSSASPKWAMGEDGKPFVLKFDIIDQDLRKRIPAAFGIQDRSSGGQSEIK
jgi:hypothetical protein